MSEIHMFRCDSCQMEVKPEYNGEHYLQPPGWVQLFDFRAVQVVGHLCKICRETAVSANLRETKMGRAVLKTYK